MDGRRSGSSNSNMRQKGIVFAKPVALALTGAALAGCAQFASLPDPEDLQALDDDRTDITYDDLTIDEIEGMDVVRNGEVVGDIEGVLGDDDSEIVAVAVDFSGGEFEGDSEVVVPIDELDFDRDEDRVELTMSDVDLARLPSWR